LQGVTIQQGDNLREEFKLVHSRLSIVAGLSVGLGGLGHTTTHLLELGIGHLFQINTSLTSAGCLGLLECFIQLARELLLASCVLVR